MEANIKSFIRKWNGRTLQDDGCYVSKEYHSFQVAFFNAIAKIAKSLSGQLVCRSYGHYDMSGFIKRNDKYVYFSYDNSCNSKGRTHVTLKENNASYDWFSPLLIRTAKNIKDFTGGTNHFASFEKCQQFIDRLLDE